MTNEIMLKIKIITNNCTLVMLYNTLIMYTFSFSLWRKILFIQNQYLT